MDIETLIEQLRSYTYWLGQDGPESHDIHPLICDDAATALSTLQSENERLKSKLHDEIEKEMKRRKTQADIIQTERGQKYEMMEKMNQIIKTMHGDCNYCLNKHSGLDGPCKGCAFSVKQEFIDGDYWEWRGLVEG